MAADPQVVDPLTTVGRLFSDLLTNYVEFGWPFLILHVVVLGLAVWAWWGLRREIGHLNRWLPDAPSRGSQSTAILDQFIAESRDLGAQGVLVPVTDFSDRLDSIVGGKVTELYERINLFLIVGIAGTLFGVFEFAIKAADVLGKNAGPERVADLGVILSSSLAKAFPVGFVGLALMFFGQVGASFSENRLKRAVADATSRALKQRTANVLSQAQIVENVAERIEKAMQPLETLQDTMATYLTPVVDKLGERLDESLNLVRAQFSELKETTRLFASAGDALGGRVAALGANIGKLDAVLHRVPDVLANFESTQKAQQEIIRTFQTNLEASLQASRQAIGALEASAGAAKILPAQILTATGEALQKVSQEISAASGVMVDALKQRLTADYNHLFQRVEEMITLLRKTVSEASDELTRNLKESAGDLFAGVQIQVTALEGLVKRSEEHLRASLDASQGTISALASMRQSAEDLPSQILTTSQSALHEVVQAAVNASNQMADGLRTQINASSELLFKQAGDQAQALREHLDATTKELLTQLSSKSDELLRGTQGQVEAVQTLVIQTTGQLEEINKAALAAVASLQGLREEAKGNLESSFDKMRDDSSKRWDEMSNKFAGETQKEFANFLEAIRAGTAEVQASLKGSAKTWSDAAFNAHTVVKEPIAEVLRNVGAELRKGIQDLDHLLIQRQKAVEDVGAFTQEWQKLLAKAEAVQQGLDRWAVSVEQSQAEMARARERFLESLAQTAPKAAASPEMASLIEGKLDEKLGPVMSDLLQMGRALEELRRRRDPLAWLPPKEQRKFGAQSIPRPEHGVEPDAGPAEEIPLRPSEPPEKPPTFLGRLWSRFRH